jgi:hypothetical protein
MVWRVGARLHAFVYGLFRPSEAELVREQWEETKRSFAQVGLETSADRQNLVATIAGDIRTQFDIPEWHPQARPIERLVERLFEYEGLLLLPEVDWSQNRTIAELWEIREELSRQLAFVRDDEALLQLIRDLGAHLFHVLYTACPALLEAADGQDGITVGSDLLHSLGGVAESVEQMMSLAYVDEVSEIEFLSRLQDRLERNLVAASGGNPADPQSFNRAPKLPSQFDSKSPEQLVATYLGGTPLMDLFDQSLHFTIPTAARFEHHHIVAGSGHGKSQTLQYLIAQDLEAVADGKRSVIVLDSQGDLIRNISQLQAFAPGEPLHDRVVIIDPTDIEWPVSLNLFDVGMDRLAGYAPLERERLTNSILELYDFVLGTLLDAQMTQKQNVIFRYVTRLMLHIPDATIHTLRELMEPDSQVKFAEHIAKLEGTAKHFFETEFASREFEQTKKQVLRRLWGILENQTFERMFSHPRSKLDLFKEMNAGKVILVNTAKDLLKEQGTEIFGRFVIALIAQAAQERATLKPKDRIPTFVYIDEAADYFDRNIGLILAQARKYNVGMVLAHQYLGQLEPKLREAFAANTAIKFAGGVSAQDARALGPMLYCAADFIEAQPKGSFAAQIRGTTKNAVPLKFPFGHLEDLPRMSQSQQKALRKLMRERYAVHHSALKAEDDANPTIEEREPELVEAKPEKAEQKRTPGHTNTTPGDSW